jgi:hypothetical protein
VLVVNMSSRRIDELKFSTWLYNVIYQAHTAVSPTSWSSGTFVVKKGFGRLGKPYRTLEDPCLGIQTGQANVVITIISH